MKFAIICMLAATVFTAPCIYDISSTEPSALGGLLAISRSMQAAAASLKLQ